MKKLLYFFRLLGIVLFFFVLSYSCFWGEVSPFAYSLLFALCFVSNLKLVYIFSAGIGLIVANFSIWSIVLGCFAISLCLLIKVLRRIIKPKFLNFVYILGVLLFSVPTIFIYADSKAEIIYYGINTLLSVFCFYLYYRLILAIKCRGMKTTFVLDEKFAMFVICLALFMGLNKLDLFSFGFDRLLISNSLMFLTRLDGSVFSFIVVLSAGCSKLALKESAGFLLNYLLWGVGLTGARKCKNITRAILLISIDFLVSGVMQVCGKYTIFSLISVVLGVGIYLIYPKRVKRKIEGYFSYTEFDDVELTHMERVELMGRLSTLSKLFYSINKVYKDMVIPTEKLENSISAMSDEVCQNICGTCVNYKVCYGSKGIKKDLTELMNVAVLKNGINHINLPTSFNSCISRASVVNQINAQVKKFKETKSTMIEQNLNKVTIGNQFKSVANMLECFSGDVENERRAEREVELDFMNYLRYEFIDCKDCRIILDQNNDFKKALLMVKLGIEKEKFLKVAGKYFKNNVAISGNKFADSSGWQVVELKYAPRYSFLYAVETVGAGGATKNGDSHSCNKVYGGNFLLSIADGKGHGDNAHKTSKRTIELIEQFFRAGIDSQTIIKSVNQIMSFNSSENFSATDICLFNPYTGLANFIKLGTTPTIIKRGNTTKAICSNALPVGACEFINATEECERLVDGDIVVMTSDGVFDAFGNINNFAGFINNLSVTNVDIFAKSILNEAIRRTDNKILDDLTIEVFKVFWLNYIFLAKWHKMN